jgi:EAL domain-containing protein (putative c-di-GMP-specific phosphodiesterase class I)
MPQNPNLPTHASHIEPLTVEAACGQCRDGKAFDIPFTMAFQPIVDLVNRRVYAYEALVRGPLGEGAGSILSQVREGNKYGFDQACRVRAIELASELGMTAKLSINFLPNAVYEPRACIRVTLGAARRLDFPLEQIIFEISESERMTDVAHVKRIVTAYRKLGLSTAIDDFGAGWSGLGLLADIGPDAVKLDLGLCRDIDSDAARQSIARSVVGMGRDLGIRVVAEGIETDAELRTLADLGVELFQGYLFAKPGLEDLPTVSF